MKEWECMQVDDHQDVGRTILEWEKNGWRLHTYQTAAIRLGLGYRVNHYLLFEKGE